MGTAYVLETDHEGLDALMNPNHLLVLSDGPYLVPNLRFLSDVLTENLILMRTDYQYKEAIKLPTMLRFVWMTFLI